MELTQTKNAPYFAFFKILGSVAVPTLGAMLLLTIAIRSWLSTDGNIDRLDLVGTALGIAVVGVAYYNFRRALNQLDGKIDEAIQFKLLIAANAMGIFGYSACMGALTLLRHH